MRVIDGDELYRKVVDYQGGAVDKTVAKRLIEQMPTIEPPTKCIAEVHADKEMVAKWINEALQNGIVHCKDCKHYIYDGDRWLCKVLSNNYEPIVDLEVDGYCSYGERTDER